MSLLYPYCTIADVQAFVDNTSGESYTLIESGVNRASRYVDDLTGRNFLFHDYSSTAYEVVDEDVCENRVTLPFEIITLTEVTLDDLVLTEGKDEDYYFRTGTRTIMHTSTWGEFPFRRELLIKGTFGYALDEDNPTTEPPPTLPQDLREAVVRIAAVFSGLWRKSVRDFDGTNEQVMVQRIPADALATVRKYSILPARAGF